MSDKAALFSKGPVSGGKTGGASVTIGNVKPNAGSTFKTSTTSGNTSAILAAAKAKKVAEAEEYKTKAETYMKTSFLQWKPDYIAAATMYERSADFYKQAEDPASAYAIMLKAAECHEGYNALASVAVAKTKAAQYQKEMPGAGREKRAAELLVQAAEFWGLSGDLAKYGETLAKAAKELENVDAKGAHELYKKSIGVLCPNNQPQSPIAVDICRNMFSFLVRNRLLAEAVAFSGDMVKILQASELEASAYKVLASVTVIQLAMGDAVKAQQTYLQDHLNVTGYLNSRECELADNLTMAFSANDAEKLDKAKKSPDMHYLDYEVQNLGKTLKLFDDCFTDDAPVALSDSVKGAIKLTPLPKPSLAVSEGSAATTTGGKSDLFAKPAPKAGASAGAAAVNKPPPPPPPPAAPSAPAAASDDEAGSEDGKDCGEFADLGAVDIPGDEDSDTEADVSRVHISPAPPVLPAFPLEEEPAEEEDDDELDLS